MGIVNTSMYGPGSLLNLTDDADPFAYIMAGVVLYQTQQFNRAVTMEATVSDLTVAGSIVSQYIGVSVESSEASYVQVLADGYVMGQSRAFNIYEDHEFTLMNSGTIEGDQAIYTVVSVASDMEIFNNGVMRGHRQFCFDTGTGDDTVENTGEIFGDVHLRDGFDRFTNTGTTIGDLDLGAGFDRFTNLGGIFVGEVAGGADSDFYIIDRDIEIVELEDEGDYDTVRAFFDYELGDHIENLQLRGTATVGIGNILDNDITGTARNNLLEGQAGDDFLDGRGGDDRLLGAAGSDNLDGGSGDNILLGGVGDDFLTGGEGTDLLNGGSGIDVAILLQSPDAITANLATQTISGGHGEGDTLVSIEGIATGDGDDSITGTNGSNWLLSFGGNDVVVAGAGADRINGGAGADQLDGGTGRDSAEYYDSASAVTINLAAGTATGGAATGDVLTGIESLLGSQFNDDLTGNNAVNVIEGFNGNDRLDGGAGIDTASYANSNFAVKVRLSEGPQDTLGAGVDRLFNFENLLGSTWNDNLRGDDGGNVLTGGKGEDVLRGDAGADIFLFASAEETLSATRDTISDFSSAQGDKIDISGIDADSALAGDQAFTFVGNAAFSGTAGELRIVYGAGVSALYGDIDGDGAADFAVRLVDVIAATPMAGTDFVL